MATEAKQEGQAIETMLLEERRYEPPPEFVAQANAQPEIYERDFEEFWETEGRERVTWFEDFQQLYEWEQPYAKWYVGGGRRQRDVADADRAGGGAALG